MWEKKKKKTKIDRYGVAVACAKPFCVNCKAPDIYIYKNNKKPFKNKRFTCILPSAVIISDQVRADGPRDIIINNNML